LEVEVFLDCLFDNEDDIVEIVWGVMLKFWEGCEKETEVVGVEASLEEIEDLLSRVFGDVVLREEGFEGGREMLVLGFGGVGL
jgi:hypothetical protein